MSRSSPPLARTSTGDPALELGRELRERIAELTERLRSEHDEYERAAQSWTEEATESKRRARRAREGTLYEIEQLLVRNGYVDRLASLERLPFARKLVELEAWISVPVSEVVSVRATAELAAAQERQPAKSHLPVLRSAAHGRRWSAARVTARSLGIGVALVALALAVIGWWAAH